MIMRQRKVHQYPTIQLVKNLHKLRLKKLRSSKNRKLRKRLGSLKNRRRRMSLKLMDPSKFNLTAKMMKILILRIKIKNNQRSIKLTLPLL